MAKRQTTKAPPKPRIKPSSKDRGELRIDYVPLESLATAARNPKGHDLETLGASFARFGFVEPMVVDERTGSLLAGHGRRERLLAAKAAGEPPPDRIQIGPNGDWLVPVVRGVATPNDGEAEAYLVASNQAVISGGWIDPVLADILRSVSATPAGLEGVGFADDDVRALLSSLDTPVATGHADPDATPAAVTSDVPAPDDRVQPGALFALGEHRVLCSGHGIRQDLQRLLAGAEIDLVLTQSPPAGKTARDVFLAALEQAASAAIATMRPGRFAAWILGPKAADFAAHQVVALEAAGLDFYRQIIWQRVLKAPAPGVYAAMHARKARTLKPAEAHATVALFTKPGDIGPLTACPLCEGAGEIARYDVPASDTAGAIALFTKGKAQPGDYTQMARTFRSDIWPIASPATMPVELAQVLIGYLTTAGEAVLDLHGQTGSTLIAAEQTGRRAYVLEADVAACRAIVARWEAFTGRAADLIA